MAHQASSAPQNYFGISDPRALDEIAGELAALRLFELEHGEPLTTFTRADLCWVHRYLLQDIYPWAGQIRTVEVGAMGLPMCRAQFVDQELERVMRDIARRSPPASGAEEFRNTTHAGDATNLLGAVSTVADHWCELTLVHPFRDGNSRTQRFFFDQLLRSAGWGVDWTAIDANEVHAARYVGAATADSSFLAEVLLPGVAPMDEIAAGTLAVTAGEREPRAAADIFRAMMAHKRAYPGQPWNK